MKKTCPVCNRAIRVFHIRDVDGGWFLNHEGANGEKCEMSLMPYPRPTLRVLDAAPAQAIEGEDNQAQRQ